MPHDLFISHAGEDKDDFVRPLAEGLRERGFEVWYDEFTLMPGASLRESIDRGLRDSRFALVVVSPAFFGKGWPEWELNGLVQLHRDTKRLLPVWLKVSAGDVTHYSPSLADIVAIDSHYGLTHVIDRVVHVLAADRLDGRPVNDAILSLQAGTVFRSSSSQCHNGQAYVSFVVGAVPENNSDLNDEQLDAIEEWFLTLEPAAVCQAATPSISRWDIIDEPHFAVWTGLLLRGPVIEMHRALPVLVDEAGNGRISILTLAGWWSRMLSCIEPLLKSLGVGRFVRGHTLNTYPVQQAPVIDLDFGECPRPRRGAGPRSIPSWAFQQLQAVAITAIDDSLLIDPLAALMRHFSYRGLDATLDWLAVRHSDGRLAASTPQAGTDFPKLRTVLGTGEGSAETSGTIEMRAEASDHGRVYQAGRGQSINER